MCKSREINQEDLKRIAEACDIKISLRYFEQ